MLGLGCEVVILSMCSQCMVPPAPSPHAIVVLEKTFSCVGVGHIPISWSNSSLFYFYSLLLAYAFLHSYIALYHDEFQQSDFVIW